MQVHRPRRVLSSVAIVLTAAVAAACGGGGDKTTVTESGSPTASADASLAAMVPADVKSDGVINVGTDTTYAPNEFLDEKGKVVGFDIELFDAIAAKLGLRAKYNSAVFGTIVEGVRTGKYEAGVSSFTINPDREKQVNMISYFNVGTQWATQQGNPSGVQPDNACGKRVAVQRDTVQVTDVEGRSKKCTQSGKKAITIDQYQAQSDATTAVVTKKDDAMLADLPVVIYAVQQTKGQLEALGDQYEAAPYGIAVAKGETGFADAIAGAVKAIIDDGTYKNILDKWGFAKGAIDNPQVNPVK